MQVGDLRLTWKTWAAILGLVVFFAFTDAIHSYAGSMAEGVSVTWWAQLLRAEVFWLIYAAVIPLALLLGHRYPLDLRRPQIIVIHVTAALVFTYLHIFLITVTLPSLRAGSDMPLFHRYLRSLRSTYALDFLTYWVIVGAICACGYYAQVRKRELSEAQLQASLAEARLRALRAQLNPHFFFNTLQIISTLAMKGSHRAVIDTVGRLSNLMRISLDDDRPQRIPLAQEMAFLDSYLQILRMWFGDRLTVECTVSGDARDALVPSMILQPLVENAIKHGVSSHPGPGRISIEARRQDGTLVLRVADSGPGFSDARRTGKGIGLTATLARLDQLYGSGYRIEYGRSSEGGAAVTISIPFAESRSPSNAVAELAS